MRRTAEDVWSAHRAALAPSLADWSAVGALAALRRSFTNDTQSIEFLEHHGLVGVWYHALSPQLTGSALNQDVEFVESLKPAQMAAIVLHALQNRATVRISKFFDDKQIDFVFIKTGGVRDELYDSLGLRPCTDIDMLVAPCDRFRAMQALQSLGAEQTETQENAAHESTWRMGLVDLDLHWDILGTGRLPPEVTIQVLARRVKTALGWRPDDVDCLFIALVHPAFAKHVCSRHMGLNRVNDTIRMLERFQIDAETLEWRLRAAGVLRAARASVFWLNLLVPEVIQTSKIKYLTDKPVTLREYWLRFCIARNLPDRWVEKHRILLNVVFTSLLHDSAKHTLRALRGAATRFGTAQNAGRAP